MKKILLSSVIILCTLITFAGEKEYMESMKSNLEELKKAETSADFEAVARNFELIAEKEANKWLPYYYVSYSLINTVFSKEKAENIDKVLDKAESFLGKARELSPGNSEIEVLQGWIYQGRIQVDPMGRGGEYSQKAAASFGKAQKLNADNPRIYLLTGQNVLYTPEQFGGGKEAACEYFLKAKDKYETFKPESPVSPDWGKEFNNIQARDCK
jgi:hypothetical protein